MLENNKTGGCDWIVGEFSRSGMVCLLEQLFSVIWCEELVSRQWREGLIVDPGRYYVIECGR